MWKLVKQYLHFALFGALLMVGEVLMDLIQPGIMRRIVDDGVLGVNAGGTGDLRLVINYGILMIFLVIVGGLCGSFNNVFVNLASHNICNNLRKICYRKIMRFSFPQLDAMGTGPLITRMTSDINQIQMFISMMVRGMVRTLFMTVGSIYFMFRLDVQFGLIVLAAFPLVAGILGFFLMKLTPRFMLMQAQLDRINSLLQENISGIRIIKACVREMYMKIRFGEANAAIVATQLAIMTLFAFIDPVVNIMMAVLVSVVLLIGSADVAAGTASPGAIMAGITYLTQLLHSILMMIMLFQGISRGRASIIRIRDILSCRSTLKNGSYVPSRPLEGRIQFEKVCFSYPGDETDTLKDIDLTINPGETVAIIGSTGSGKSTLTGLIDRFYDVGSGRILLDGTDLRDYQLEYLRGQIAYTRQKTELFSVSIADNIRWGRPDASMDEVRQAAQIAQADGFISEQPDGYETVVAEKGKSLSGGQKQRLAIARTVIKNAPVMIFDDSTSALDLTTESRFYQALGKYNPCSTRIIVAQRISSVANADRIFILDHGRIAAEGTHRELLENCEIYQDIYRSQIGDEKIL